MKGHDWKKSIALVILVIFLPSNPILSGEVQKVHSFSAPTKFSSRHGLRHSRHRLESGSEFADEVSHFLDRQPEVSYTSVDLPLNILDVYPTVKNIGNEFIELERKRENMDQNNGNVILLHLISTPTRLDDCLPPKFQKDLTDYFNQKKENNVVGSTNERHYTKVVHLHEDIWNFKRDIVRHRLMAQLGLGVHFETSMDQQWNENHGGTGIRRIFARKTKVRRITSSVAMPFLDENHLWGATKAKHNYGLFVSKKGKNDSSSEDELVAVATFSAKRKVVRLGKQHRSHELLRFCSRRDSNVVGGISKLIKAFVAEKSPDDIVTVVDRDWGDGSGWHSLGFHTVATMDPIVMAVCDSTQAVDSSHSKRRHLVGAGIKSSDSMHSTTNNNNVGSNSASDKRTDRLGLSSHLLEELDSLDSVDDILDTLSREKHFPVYDTGVERLMKVIAYDSEGKEVQTAPSTIVEMWCNSQPTYAKDYYSPNRGIAVLLKNAAVTQSALPLLIGDEKSVGD